MRPTVIVVLLTLSLLVGILFTLWIESGEATPSLDAAGPTRNGAPMAQVPGAPADTAVATISDVDATVKLVGAGATFPAPLYTKWVSEFGKTHPGIRIEYQAIGSGGGVKAIGERTVSFAASDTPMSKAEIEKSGGQTGYVQVPSCAGGIVPAYNVPGVVTDLKFAGEILAEIYLGKIVNWNDPKFAALNPGVTLPDLEITPVYRTDGSATTLAWTSYLATQSGAFKDTIGAGKQVRWAVGQGVKGGEGISATIRQTIGAIGFVEQSIADASKIPYGSVKNRAGKFVKASPATVSAAGTGAAEQMIGTILAANAWDQPGDEAYPIASFTYLIVRKDLAPLTTRAEAQALTDFLWWAMHDSGQKLASQLDYAPLAPAVAAKVEQALATIGFHDEALTPAR